ncbi:hypothetical protein LCGC14_3118650 [marine sediment metagenome]|uniref:Uncharacterized protein n=1 Tax=marine sediment metagenome TaxID=412755 RepID=A0A0F8YAD6_9ZZZZ
MGERVTGPEDGVSEFGYVAIHSCGKIVAATVDSPENKGKSRDVAGWIRRNESVERMAIEAVRKDTWCKCYRSKKKAQ